MTVKYLKKINVINETYEQNDLYRKHIYEIEGIYTDRTVERCEIEVDNRQKAKVKKIDPNGDVSIITGSRERRLLIAVTMYEAEKIRKAFIRGGLIK